MSICSLSCTCLTSLRITELCLYYKTFKKRRSVAFFPLVVTVLKKAHHTERLKLVLLLLRSCFIKPTRSRHFKTTQMFEQHMVSEILQQAKEVPSLCILQQYAAEAGFSKSSPRTAKKKMYWIMGPRVGVAKFVSPHHIRNRKTQVYL